MRHLVFILVSCLAAMSACAAQGNYLDRSEAQALIDSLVNEHQLDRAALESVLASAKHDESVIEAISRPKERTLEWHEYREIFLQPLRVRRGLNFWRENADSLARALADYGVPPEVIVAIIGVETDYGRVTGNHRALDSLATLGFDYPPRSEFFFKELKHLLLLASEEGKDAGSLKGSYAGALGLAQFMPSSFRAFAVDFSGDAQRDIWHSSEDAIGSVANYLAEHGWRENGQVLFPVGLGDGADLDALRFQGDFAAAPSIADMEGKGVMFDSPEWSQSAKEEQVMLTSFDSGDGHKPYAGLNNFYVITRYNRSHMYARAVHELSQMLLQDFAQ